MKTTATVAVGLLVLTACGPSIPPATPSRSAPAWTHTHPTRVSRSVPHRPTPPKPKVKAAPKTTPRPMAHGWVRLIQLCIAHYESHGNPKAANPNGVYFGRYQFEDGLWYGTTGLRGHASAYPASVQDAAFLKVFAGGKGRHRWPHTYALCRAQYGGPA